MKTLRDVEKELIIQSLQKFNCNREETSKALGIHRQSLYLKMKKYKIIVENTIKQGGINVGVNKKT